MPSTTGGENMDLPPANTPLTNANNYTIKENHGTNSKQFKGFVDSDWATNTKKRKQ